MDGYTIEIAGTSVDRDGKPYAFSRKAFLRVPLSNEEESSIVFGRTSSSDLSRQAFAETFYIPDRTLSAEQGIFSIKDSSVIYTSQSQRKETSFYNGTCMDSGDSIEVKAGDVIKGGKTTATIKRVERERQQSEPVPVSVSETVDSCDPIVICETLLSADANDSCLNEEKQTKEVSFTQIIDIDSSEDELAKLDEEDQDEDDESEEVEDEEEDEDDEDEEEDEDEDEALEDQSKLNYKKIKGELNEKTRMEHKANIQEANGKEVSTDDIGKSHGPVKQQAPGMKNAEKLKKSKVKFVIAEPIEVSDDEEEEVSDDEFDIPAFLSGEYLDTDSDDEKWGDSTDSEDDVEPYYRSCKDVNDKVEPVREDDAVESVGEDDESVIDDAEAYFVDVHKVSDSEVEYLRNDTKSFCKWRDLSDLSKPTAEFPSLIPPPKHFGYPKKPFLQPKVHQKATPVARAPQTATPVAQLAQKATPVAQLPRKRKLETEVGTPETKRRRWVSKRDVGVAAVTAAVTVTATLASLIALGSSE